MNELMLSVNNTKTMSSRDIAELTGKMHKDVLEAVRNMEAAWEKITGRKFPLSEYKDSTGRKLPMYQLSKTECLYVATKFNDEARAKLVLRWEELETKPQLDFNNPDTVLMLAQNWKEEQEKRILAEKQLQEQKPKVLFAESIEGSNTNILIGDLAKILNQNGIKIGQNRLYSWMVENKYLIRRSRWSNSKNKYEHDYIPTQKAAELKVFFVTETAVSISNSTFIKHTCKITGKGQVYFLNKFLKSA